jgi:uncharacterized protein YyaL (SSP411 family)
MPENQGAQKGPAPATMNHLEHEKSPYLLQHAANPVDWYPWGDDAFSRASREGKPVFLSIGYATCHWCHVMAHESFEDPDVAALLNRDFVCVKVDREERPDIDRFYMGVSQMMTGRGGWPLTIIMTPEKKPFFAATYIPKESRFGMAGLSDLLPRIVSLWRDRREDLLNSAEAIVKSQHPEPVKKESEDPDMSLLNECYEELVLRFDPEYGGFSNAPKFPTPHTLLFLLRYWKRTGKDRALVMIEKTLLALSLGGIHDHLGGGFHRYSTDTRWRVPHFEKMLYDQALLLMAYTEVFQATQKPEYRDIAADIIGYVLRDLTSEDGVFLSAEDADSEGREGTFYLWTKTEIRSILGPRDADLAERVFNISSEGNFYDAETAGGNILYIARPVNEIAPSLGMTGPELEARLSAIRSSLFQTRSRRLRPLRDDKQLTDWNGLFIAALAQSARVFDDGSYLAAAQKAMQALLARMQVQGGGLLHRYRDGEAAIPAFGEDYAFVIMALIQLYHATSDPEYVSTAIGLNEYFTRHFADEVNGGYFSVSDYGEVLPVRNKDVYDGAIPSCNSVAFDNLLRLAALTGDERFGEKAAGVARTFLHDVMRSPSSHTWFLCVVDRALGPSQEVVIAGESDPSGTSEMMNAIRSHYLPNLTVICLKPGLSRSKVETIAPFVRGMVSREGCATVYVCSGKSCAEPVTKNGQMLELLGVRRGKSG